MRYLFCDASWRNGVGGVAVVAPEAPWQRGTSWRQRLNVRNHSIGLPSERTQVFYTALPSPSSHDAELRALGLACALASELLQESRDVEEPVEIISDCLAALDEVLWGEFFPQESVAEDIRAFCRDKAIIFSKVRAHRGHCGNELADMWARRARIDHEELQGFGGIHGWAKDQKEPTTEAKTEKGASMTMRIPCGSKEGKEIKNSARGCGYGGYGSEGRNLFPGATPADILTMTEKTLEGGDGGDFIAVITRDGHVVPRNEALRSGNKEFTELAKERIWGYGEGRGSYEEELARFTERVLGDENSNPVVTSQGKVIDRNDALRQGETPAVELVKERVWGGDVRDDSGLDEDHEGQEDREDEEEDLVPIPLVTVAYAPQALDRIREEMARNQGHETGGALVGRVEKGDDGGLQIVVERATGPGSEGLHSAVHLRPDLDHYRRRVAYYRQTFGWIYVGEWHSHPGDLRTLSATDRKTAREVLRDEDRSYLVLPVVTLHGEEVCVNTHVAIKAEAGDVEFLWLGEDRLSRKETKNEMPLYLNARWLESFRGGDAETIEYPGVHHPGASFVFLPGPGERNARLFMTKKETSPVRNSGVHVVGFVTPTEARFFRLEEGEAFPVRWRTVRPEEDVYVRNEGLLENLALRGKSVLLVGCGSLGSTMAVELARAGIGRFILLDPDRLEPHNIARHQGTLTDLGRLKVHVVQDAIGGIAPDAAVESYPWDIVRDGEVMAQVKTLASSCHLLVCTTDTDSSRLFVNDLSLELGIPSLQAGLHERAHSGIVQVVGGRDAACFACHRGSVLREDGKRNAVAYSAATTAKDLVVQPGLSAQINLVAEVAVLRALDVLAETLAESDLTVVTMTSPEPQSGPDDEGGAKPWLSPHWSGLSLRFLHFDLEKSPHCPVCGGSSLEEALLEDEEVEDAWPDAGTEEEGLVPVPDPAGSGEPLA